MDPPPIAPKPRAVLSSHLTNGANHVPYKSSPLGRTSINLKEREKLTASIRSSSEGRQPLKLEEGSVKPLSKRLDEIAIQDGPWQDSSRAKEATNGVPPRDPRDVDAVAAKTPTASRPASPYTLNPPIDFDGLSWPSEWTRLAHILRHVGRCCLADA